MARRLPRGEAPEPEDGEAELEDALNGVRYMLRLSGRPSTSQLDAFEWIDLLDAADVDELRELAVELDCAPALKALDQADRLLAAG